MFRKKVSKNVIFVFIMSFFFFFSPVVNAQNNELQAGRVDEGVMLHAWNWSFKNITNNMENIHNAGYTTIQTSPINAVFEGGDNSKNGDLMHISNWYYLYQPTSYKIGNQYLGSEEDFKEMCAKAKEYGIKVIVDAVLNHTTATESAIDPEIKKISNWTHGNRSIDNWNDRYQVTQLALLGLWDFNTQNSEVQKYLKDFVNRVMADGASGFRYDAAKHIELPSDQGYGSNFWPNITDNGSEFQYGEVLQDSISRDTEYAKYMGVTASHYGDGILNALKNKTVYVDDVSPYHNGVKPNRLVTWVESHDMYANGEDKADGDVDYAHSVWMSDEDIKIGWSVVASRAQSVPLFFSRPVGGGKGVRFPNQSKMGDAGSDLYKDKTISEINKFHNLMVGKSELLVNPNNDHNVLITYRGNSGAVVTNISSQAQTINTESRLNDGEYIDKISGKKISVVNGRFRTTIPARTVLIVYDEKSLSDKTEKEEIKFVKPDNWGQDIYAYIYDKEADSVVGPWPGLKMTKENTTNLYSVELDSKLINNNLLVIFSDGKQQSPAKDGFKFISGKTYDVSGIVNTPEEVKKENIKFIKPDSWSQDIYAYIYDKERDTSVVGKWPGLKMTKEDGENLYGVDLDSKLINDNLLVIFSDGKVQSPAKDGFKFVPGKTYNIDGEVEEKKPDNSILYQEIESFNNINSEQYTSQSYENLAQIIEEAKKIYLDNKASQETIDSTVSKIKDAKNALEKKVNKEILGKSVYTGKSIDSTKYTEKSFADLKSVLDEAEEVLNNPKASQEEVDLINTKLNKSIESLQIKEISIDKKALKNSLDAAKIIEGANYTDESYNQLQIEIANAEKIFNSSSVTQEEINQSVIDLNKKISDLKSKPALIEVNKEVLKKILEVANAVNQADYTKESLNVLDLSKKRAETILNDSQATQAQVDDTALELGNAILALEKKQTEVPEANKNILRKMLEKAQSTDNSKYTDESLKILQEVISKAKEIDGNKLANQEEVDNTTLELTEALLNLVEKKKVNKDILSQLIESSKVINPDSYTDESYKLFEESLRNAQEIEKNVNSTQIEVNQAVINLNKAITALEIKKIEVPKVNKEVLDKTVKASQSINTDLYTKESVDNLLKAIEDAKKLQTDNAVSQSQVDDAVIKLNDAMASLKTKPIVPPLPKTDKKVLNKSIEAAQSVKKDIYSKKTYDALQKVLENTKKVQINEQASQAEIDKATSDLNRALSELRLNPCSFPSYKHNKTVLNKSVEAGLLINKANYTKSSYDTLEKAIIAGKRIQSNNWVNQEQINRATIAINKAIADLQLK
ncbi:starch-binding protein [Floricoccus penangensis]|uniref:starch-binding protein n=1 Tax=Floricoccus penangensis TaxID=1859475 RepID=UPI002040D949|nr:starch-binding protein [Floricoccus penangensis]URZ87933.1 FIVAR domain-containing protein [Floricoccus penangensis]